MPDKKCREKCWGKVSKISAAIAPFLPSKIKNKLCTEKKEIPPQIEEICRIETSPLTLVPFEEFSAEHSVVSGLDLHDGLKLSISKPLGPFHISSRVAYGPGSLGPESNAPPALPDVTVQASYAPNMSNLCSVQLDRDFFQGRYMRKVNRNLELSISGGLESWDIRKPMAEMKSDIFNDHRIVSTKVLYRESLILSSSFSQLVAPRLQLGSELTFAAATRASIVAVCARCKAWGDFIFSCSVGRQPNFAKGLPPPLCGEQNFLRTQIFKPISETNSVGAEFEITHPFTTPAGRLSWMWNQPTKRIQTVFDVSGKIASVYTTDTGFTFSFSADPLKNSLSLGMGMALSGGAEEE